MDRSERQRLVRLGPPYPRELWVEEIPFGYYPELEKTEPSSEPPFSSEEDFQDALRRAKWLGEPMLAPGDRPGD